MSEDMIDRVIYDETVDALRISILHARELADRIAALEAEASEGERRKLEVERLVDFNAMLIRDNERYQEAGSALAAAALRVTSEFDGVHRLRLAASAWAKAAADEGDRALIPEALAQPELASAAANQLSGSRVGEPAREGNPEDHPRYPALLDDAKARVRNENLDGSPRRHAVAKEGE